LTKPLALGKFNDKNHVTVPYPIARAKKANQEHYIIQLVYNWRENITEK
jgi:hypothetical protein